MVKPKQREQWKGIQRDGDSFVFGQRLAKLGFKQTEIALLLGRSSRCVNYYAHGERGIPPSIWVRLKAIEEKSRDDICQLIVDAQSQRKKSKKKK